MGGQMHRKQSTWHASWIVPPLQFVLENITRYWLIQEQQFHFSVIPLINTLKTVSRPLYNPKTANLNTTNGSSMAALGMTALHFRIADFKFTHNFVICNRLPDVEIIFGIDIQKKFSISYTWEKEKNCYIQWHGNFLTYTKNCEQKATIGTVKSSLKILPRHNGVIPIKTTGLVTEGHIAYFITYDNSTKVRDPNINIIIGIHSIKGKNICQHIGIYLNK